MKEIEQARQRKLELQRQTIANSIKLQLYEPKDLYCDNVKAYEELWGLTKAIDFTSQAKQIVLQREQMREDAKDVTVYEGRVPIHQRLRLLCYDFIESTQDYTSEELDNF